MALQWSLNFATEQYISENVKQISETKYHVFSTLNIYTLVNYSVNRCKWQFALQKSSEYNNQEYTCQSYQKNKYKQ